MQFMNALEQAQWHIKTLWRILLVTILLMLIMLYGWLHAVSQIRVDIPPTIPASGLTLTRGQVPKTTVFSFAFYIWQRLNDWPQNGMHDDKVRLKQCAPFLTPKFQATLINQYNERLLQGELQDRTRRLTGLAGSFYTPTAVRTLGHHTWQVTLTLQLTERLQHNDTIIKAVDMRYVLLVVARNTDPKRNPWGLALAGFVKPPQRIKTLV